MSPLKLCTQMAVPEGLQDLADTVAVIENPFNGHQTDAWTVIAAGMGSGDEPLRLALPVGSMWANGRTLRVKIYNGSPKIRSKIRQYASIWSQYANIQFNFVDDADAEIRVNVDNSGESWSRVGTGCYVVPYGQPTMNLGWLTDSTPDEEFSRVIVHEFGHALGCIHEHQSPAGGIKWNKQAVYDHYKDWAPSKVDLNIFQLYSKTTTQFSEFDVKSIMLYSIPAELTTDGFSTPWNTELSETDIAFINQTYPDEKPDTGSFSTTEVRLKQVKGAVQRQVFEKRFDLPPAVAVGLTSLDIAGTTDVRVTAFADKITTVSADVHINTWSDTTLYSAAATWFKAAANDPDFQIGQVSTLDSGKPTQGHMAIPVTFDRSYSVPPQVVVWLNSFEMGYDHNWGVAASVSDVTARGFVLHFDSGRDTVLKSASAAWIALPNGKAGVLGGSFSTPDAGSRDETNPVSRGQIRFPQGVFQKAPSTIVVALNGLDIPNGHSLRVKVSVETTAADGIAWRIETWGDGNVVHWASASYIALA